MLATLGSRLDPAPTHLSPQLADVIFSLALMATMKKW